MSALALELAKCLKLVAPVSMDSDAQLAWIASAVDALEGIRAEEVKAVSAELRRSVTRHNQIVPEVAKLVAEKRSRANRTEREISPYAAEMGINAEAQKRRAKISAKDKRALSEVWEWERQARIDSGLHVEPYPKPLSHAELEGIPDHVRKMGLAHGFLEWRGGELSEVRL
jgi:hypothetical protein